MSILLELNRSEPSQGYAYLLSPDEPGLDEPWTLLKPAQTDAFEAWLRQHDIEPIASDDEYAKARISTNVAEALKQAWPGY